MNEKETKKKREWVKNAAIVFLSIMLVLTFFSNYELFPARGGNPVCTEGDHHGKGQRNRQCGSG